MYKVELSEAVLNDLKDFSLAEVEEIFLLLLSLPNNPKPAGLQAIPLPEVAGGVAYHYETTRHSLFYAIFEAMRVVKIVAIFKKINLN